MRKSRSKYNYGVIRFSLGAGLVFVVWATDFEFWGQNFCLRHGHMLGWAPFICHLQSSLVFVLQSLKELIREANQWLMN